MELKYIWDTNTAIYYLQAQFPALAEVFIDTSLITQGQPCISVITEIELLCWKTLQENDLKLIKNFISDSLVIELDQSIKLKTAEIRKSHKVKLPDAIIAASALAFDLTLITRNVADFRNIDGLTLLNPFDL